MPRQARIFHYRSQVLISVELLLDGNKMTHCWCLFTTIREDSSVSCVSRILPLSTVPTLIVRSRTQNWQRSEEHQSIILNVGFIRQRITAWYIIQSSPQLRSS